MDVQVPGVAMQVWQLPVQAELQHKPWVQKPRPQSAFAEHACPGFFLQLPLKQAYPLATSQAPFVVQVVAHEPPAQR
jgi:hypothetical protein